MNIKFLKISFRKKIIIAVVGLASIPVVLMGINALRLAGGFQSAAGQTKEMLLSSLASNAENYFIRVNENLGFIKIVEENSGDDSRIASVLFNALMSNREMSAVAYIKDNKVEKFFGDEKFEGSLNKRVSSLLKKYKEGGNLHLSDSFRKNGLLYFDLLYSLESPADEILIMTFSLNEIQDMLNANKIEDTGEFALLKEDGFLFAGSQELARRMDYLSVSEVLSGREENLIKLDRGEYVLKGQKLNLAWPIWIIFTQRKGEARALTSKLRTDSILFLFLILAASGILSFMLASEFSKPISNLLDAVKKNYNGELTVKAPLRENDKGELAVLIKGFNKMIDGLREAREKLVEKEKMAAVGEMANVIGHDIRNPLAAIKNGTYFLRYAVKDKNDKIEKTMNIIEREIENIAKIIEDLLGYSRQRPPELSPVDVKGLADEAISIIEVPENVRIEKNYSRNLPEFNLDRNEIKQVLVNIINNAVQACEKEEGVVKIITEKDYNGNLIIRVIDNGEGIPKDKMENIFKAFYSTKGGGTGLGMSSAKNIIERHEGSINVKSEVKKGSEIILTVPFLKIKDEK
ncbi:MAG: ATP-binding protein [Elusimicrobiota bacterium]